MQRILLVLIMMLSQFAFAWVPQANKQAIPSFHDSIRHIGHPLIGIQYFVYLSPEYADSDDYLPFDLTIAQLSEQLGFKLMIVQRQQYRLVLMPQLLNGQIASKVPFTLLKAQLRALVSALKALPGVVRVEPNTVEFPAYTKQEPLMMYQWFLQEYQDIPGGTNIQSAWSLNKPESDVTVAILDTGILSSHPDLEGQLLPGYDFISNEMRARDDDPGRDDNPEDMGDYARALRCGVGPSEDTSSSFHGTHLAGIIGAKRNNQGIVGVAEHVKILPIRVMGVCGGRANDIVDAIYWAAGIEVEGAPVNTHPADVINLSFSQHGPCGESYQAAIDRVTALGIPVVVAAGNDELHIVDARPANCRNVIVVGASHSGGGRAEYSNYGESIDVMAPGGMMAYCEIRKDSECARWHKIAPEQGILSLANRGLQQPEPNGHAYIYRQGTSMAAAQVTAVVALIKSVNPTIRPAEIKFLLQETARTHFPPMTKLLYPLEQCNPSLCGAGLLDAYAAVEKAIELR